MYEVEFFDLSVVFEIRSHDHQPVQAVGASPPKACKTYCFQGGLMTLYLHVMTLASAFRRGTGSLKAYKTHFVRGLIVVRHYFVPSVQSRWFCNVDRQNTLK